MTGSGENAAARPASEPAGGTGAAGESGSTFLKSNRGVASLLMLLVAALAAYIWFSDWAHRELRDGFLLGGFPLFAVFMMAVSVLILLLDRQARTVEPGLAACSLAAGLVVLAGAAVLGLTFLSFDYLGFVPAVTLFILGVSTLFGYRPVWSAGLVGLLVAGVLRVMMYALGVDIPDGLIWTFVTAAAG